MRAPAPLRRWPQLAPRRTVRAVLQGYDDHDLLTFASAIAFQVLTAVVPLLLLVLGLLGSLHLTEVWQDEVRPEVAGRVSRAALVVIDGTVAQVLGDRQVFWVTLGAVLAAWQVSGAVRAAMDVLNRVHGTREERSFVRRYAVSLALALVFMLVLVAALAVVNLVPLVDGDPGPVVGALLLLARWGTAAGLLLLGMGLLLHFGPDRTGHLGWTSLGSVLVVGSWVVCSGLFLLYLTRLASYGSVFGALATVVVLSGYLYLSAIVFVTGIQVDALLRADVLDEGDASRPHRDAVPRSRR